MGYQVDPPKWGGVSTTTGTVPASPFDIAGISAEIDRAAASLAPTDLGSLTVKLDRESGLGAGLVLRVPKIGQFDPRVLATITRPVAGRWGWSVAGRVAFLAALEPGSEDVVPKLKAQQRVRIAAEVRGMYRLLRRWNGPIAAAVKAIAVHNGAEVRLVGRLE